jgi:hypothetical protein
MSNQLLISKSNINEVYNLFQTFNNNGRRSIKAINKPNHDQTIPDDVEMIQMRLPYELSRRILIDVIYWHLRNKTIQEACELMSINKDLIHYFYVKYAGVTQIGSNILREHSRLARTLCMVNNMHDLVVDEPNVHRSEYFCFETFVRDSRYKLGQTAVEPLDFFRMDRHGLVLPMFSLMSIPKPIIMGQDCYQSILTGLSYLDVAWLMGYQGRRYFQCTALKRPVFIIGLMDPFGALISIPGEGYHTHMWIQYAKLLKCIYGPTTGVYLVLNDTILVSEDEYTVELVEI